MEGMPTKQRPISLFMAQELLHDYISGRLDQSRRNAVEKSLKEHPQLQKDLELFKAADEYCEQLSKTKVNQELLVQLGQKESLAARVGHKLTWKRWPDAMKWTTEALVLSTMVIMFTLVAPWEDIQSWVKWGTSEPAIMIGEPPQTVAEAEPVQEAQPEPVKPTVAEKKVVVVAAKPTVAPAKPQGVLFRMNMKVSNIESKADQVTDKILSLGGKKAGRVRLGWRKETGNYYHFSIPENKKAELTKTLGELGPVRIYSHPHERVMPEGDIRIILFIEDGPVEEIEGPVEAPAEPIPEVPTDEQAETEQEEA